MDDEYISKKQVADLLSTLINPHDLISIHTIGMAIHFIENEPAAYVQPVKHGKWISQGDDMWLCSNCKENIIYSMHESDRTEKQRYCCKCGARMDLNSVTHDICSNYMNCDGSCFIDDTPCNCDGNIEKCKGR